MKKRITIALAAIIVVIVVFSVFAATQINPPVAAKKPFYVGVTYCGNSIAEAQQLVDKVKNYTNLFVLDSGPLQDNVSAIEQIGDYAVNSGLNFMLCHSNPLWQPTKDNALNAVQGRWGSSFLGFYFDDEPGGKLLDGLAQLFVGDQLVTKQSNGYLMVTQNPTTGNSSTGGTSYTMVQYYASLAEVNINRSFFPVNQTVDGVENVTVTSNENTYYYPNGTIINFPNKNYMYSNGTSKQVSYSSLYYLPNGTVLNQAGQAATQNPNGTYTIQNTVHVYCTPYSWPWSPMNQTDSEETVSYDPGNCSQFESYQQLWDSLPITNSSGAANALVNTCKHGIAALKNQSNVKLFTADYGLDWFDYKGGYDVVLGELGWNQSVTQNIALVRGAADAQNKSWGTIIVWQNQSPLTLMNGTEMYNAMRQSYRSGAQYVVVFNFSPNNNGTGLLQTEHFDALEKFWKDVVYNSRETNNFTPDAAFVLPQDFGGGLRNRNDHMWGLWVANSTSQQVWDNLQAALNKYGSKLDIVYDDPAYPTAGRYQHVWLWNQTT